MLRLSRRTLPGGSRPSASRVGKLLEEAWVSLRTHPTPKQHFVMLHTVCALTVCSRVLKRDGCMYVCGRASSSAAYGTFNEEQAAHPTPAFSTNRQVSSLLGSARMLVEQNLTKVCCVRCWGYRRREDEEERRSEQQKGD
jgi:hypothetical protein